MSISNIDFSDDLFLNMTGKMNEFIEASSN